MYVVCKMIQKRIFLLVHCGITSYKLYQKSNRFLWNLFSSGLALITYSMSSIFILVFHHFCLYSAEDCLFFFFHCDVFHSIKTYFIMLFLFPLLYNSLLWVLIYPVCRLSQTDISTWLRVMTVQTFVSDLFAIWVCINCYQ